MLIPNTLFFYISNQRGLSCLPFIKWFSVRAKRSWQNRSDEEKEKFRKMRSRVQKETAKNNPHLKEIRAKSFREVTQKYWDTIEKDKKKEHIAKMSSGMKKAWDEGGEDFGPELARINNLILLNGNKIIESDLPRINDYSGVITSSEMAELNGSS